MTGSFDGVRPALSLVATAGKRAAVLEAAVEAEQRGFTGLALPSLGGTMGFATSLAHATTSIAYWTSIQPIYLATAAETGATAGHLHEPIAPGPTNTAAIVHPAPIVGTFHAAGDSAGYRMLQPFVRWMAGHLELRCAVSPDAAALAKRYMGGTYEVLFNGIELDRYRGGEPAKSSSPTIFFCGRHEPRKGLEVLLEALQQLPADVRLWVASNGPDTARLQATYAGDPRVEWLGRITEGEKAARLQGASVFCAPALGGESFGVVLLEAMAAGTAVVASDIPGYRNVAAPGRDAVMVPPADPAALAVALRRVLTDDDLATRVRTAGTARVESFSMDHLAALYLERYQRILTEAATTRASPRGGRLARRMRGSWARR